MTEIQGIPVIARIAVDDVVYEPFSDDEFLYIPQIQSVYRESAYNHTTYKPYWLKIPLSLIRGDEKKEKI